MINKRIELPVRPLKDSKVERFIPSITTYIIENNVAIDKNKKRPLVLICPGGAYGHKSFRESEPVALKMMAMGFNACVLDYSVAPLDFPVPFMELCEAVYYIRTHASELNTDPNKIIVGGFSAGGHLATSLAVWWNTDMVTKYLPYKPEDVKPNALMLGYPVITSGEFCHQGSVANLLGEKMDIKEYREKISFEKHITKDFPPTFVWHTADDQSVPVQNSIFLISELAAKEIVFESHIFRSGCHGLSLATKESAGNPVQINPECAVWPEMFKSFAEKIFE